MIKIKLIDCGGHMYVKLDGTNGPSIYSYLFDGVDENNTIRIIEKALKEVINE